MGVALPVGFLRVKVGLFNAAQPDKVVEVEAYTAWLDAIYWNNSA
jgi:hypothetical protein